MRLGKYKGIQAKRPDVTITEKDILKVLTNKQKENSVVTNIEGRCAQSGDQAILDFDGTQEGIPIPGGKKQNYPLVLGSHTFVPGFEEQIIGKNPGESFDICVTFPEHYHIKQLEGKPVIFHTTLKKLFLPEYQPLDDDFAKDFSDYDTLSDWKESIRERLTLRREASAYEKLSRDILSAIIENSDIPIDDDLKRAISEEFYDDFLYTLEENRMTLDTYCQRSGYSKEAVLMQQEQKAIRTIQEQSVLHAIASKEHIDITEEELNEELCELAAEEEESLDEFRSMLDEEEIAGITDQLRMNKTLEFVLNNAVLK